MAALTEIVKGILFIVILASFLELLLPEGGLKPFVRFSIGLFILITVLNPVLSFLFRDHQLKVDLWDYKIDTTQSDQIIDKGKNLNREIVESNNESVQQKLQGQISSVAMLVPGVENAAAEIQTGQEGAPEKLFITVTPGRAGAKPENQKVQVFSEAAANISAVEKEEIENKIKSLISNLYGFPNQDIEVEFEGGGK